MVAWCKITLSSCQGPVLYSLNLYCKNLIFAVMIYWLSLSRIHFSNFYPRRLSSPNLNNIINTNNEGTNTYPYQIILPVAYRHL